MAAGARAWRDGTATLTAKIAASCATIGEQYKRTSPRQPWKSHRRRLTLTERREVCVCSCILIG
jgi:hypothetical protein